MPALRYDAIDGVQDSGMAQDAFLQAIHASTSPARKQQLEQQLLDYCQLEQYEITATVVDTAQLDWWLRGFGAAVSAVKKEAIYGLDQTV